MQTGAPSSPSKLVILGVGFYLLLAFLLFHRIMTVTGGHFTYSLDDPYIHLALAENLAHGHYGINAAEYSSPSSSLIWPFLLIVGAGTTYHAFVPLAWNLLFGVIAAALLGWTVATWPPQVDEQGHMPWWKQAVTVLLLVFAANLPGLTMLGMEHVLQVMLTICCAIGMAKALSEGAIPGWCLAAAVLAPSVRYEDLTLTLAISLALVGLRQWKAGASVFGISLVPLLAFSLFLKSKGLPLLPLSVLVKGNAFVPASLPVKVAMLLISSAHDALNDPERYPIAVLCFLFAGLTWHEKVRSRRFIFLGAATLGGLQLLFGRFGWLYRYEVYAAIFLTILCLRVLAERPRFLFGYFSLGLLFCASSYLRAAEITSTAAREIYLQQYQLHRFVTGFYQGDYAVNDLGWTSFKRRPGTYVLDLAGLGSEEASRHPVKSAAWLESIVTRHHIPLVMVYPQWFQIPASWEPLAEMCLAGPAAVVAHQCVLFYSTSLEAGSALAQADALRGELQRFGATLPADDILQIAHSRADTAAWAPTMR